MATSVHRRTLLNQHQILGESSRVLPRGFRPSGEISQRTVLNMRAGIRPAQPNGRVDERRISTGIIFARNQKNNKNTLVTEGQDARPLDTLSLAENLTLDSRSTDLSTEL